MNPHVYVVEDDSAMRQTLIALMKSVDLKTKGYSNAHDFLNETAPSATGCVLLDIRMPDMGGIELFDKMKESGYQLPVILVTAFANVRIAVDAMKNGAFDIVEKPFDDQHLIDRVFEAIRQDEEQKIQNASRSQAMKLYERMTSREKDIFLQISRGFSNKEIADRLKLSIRTVETHRAQVIKKLEIKGIADLVRIAIQLDIT